MPNSSIDSLRASAGWAEVRANGRIVRYRRLGSGRSVVVLASPSDPSPPWPELMDALGASFRVIFPDPPEADGDIGDWLADFLEGLGIWNVGIVAADRFCIPTLELTLLGVDQVGRIVLVPNGDGAATRVGGVLDVAMGQAVVPLLIVRDDQPADQMVGIIRRFLAA